MRLRTQRVQYRRNIGKYTIAVCSVGSLVSLYALWPRSSDGIQPVDDVFPREFRARAEATCSAMLAANQLLGLDLRSSGEFERILLGPKHSSYAVPAGSKQICVLKVPSGRGGDKYFAVFRNAGSVHRWLLAVQDAIPPGERTKEILEDVSSGANGHTRRINKVRQLYDDEFRRVLGKRNQYRSYYSGEASSLKVAASPINTDVPQNASDANLYASWIAKTLGTKILNDAYGRPVRVTVANGAFECRSAGPDGLFGTPDDIVVRTRVRTVPDGR